MMIDIKLIHIKYSNLIFLKICILYIIGFDLFI
jgi:hypothetical protein